MSNDLTLTKTFQERMFERIRDDIGELMSDEDLRRVVDSAVQKAFFEPIVTKDVWGRITETPPPLVIEMTKLMRERVDAAIREWVMTHPDEIAKIIDDVISRGIVTIVMNYFDQRTFQPLQALSEALRAKGLLAP